MTADNAITAVYINGKDVTSELTPGGDDLSYWTSVKQITFAEPASESAVIAVLARDREDSHAPDKSGLQVMCTATRAQSAWNDVVTFEALGKWQSIPVNISSGLPPNGWFMSTYSGPKYSAVQSSSKFYMMQPICGPLDKYRKVAAEGRTDTPFFALRAIYPQSKVCTSNGTAPPTTARRDPFKFELETNFAVDPEFASKPREDGGFAGLAVAQLDSSERSAVNRAIQYWQAVVVQSMPTRACIPAGLTLCGVRFDKPRCFADMLLLVSSQVGLEYVFHCFCCCC